jgi:hypothetical protein
VDVDPQRSDEWTPVPPELLVPVTPAEAEQIPTWLHRRALAEVAFAYETIAEMAAVPRAGLNRSRPDAARFANATQVVQEYTARADAVAQFAASLGLITPEQMADVIQQFAARHPGVWPNVSGERP